MSQTIFTDTQLIDAIHSNKIFSSADITAIHVNKASTDPETNVVSVPAEVLINDKRIIVSYSIWKETINGKEFTLSCLKSLN
ncbi:MAG: hypothetical protein PF440_04820 [Thiomicrorhabdus sp.]|jgi:hypothetical protein|nr:hypothetical protein [Thiomicrorhabdus sp.]